MFLTKKESLIDIVESAESGSSTLMYFFRKKKLKHILLKFLVSILNVR